MADFDRLAEKDRDGDRVITTRFDFDDKTSLRVTEYESVNGIVENAFDELALHIVDRELTDFQAMGILDDRIAFKLGSLFRVVHMSRTQARILIESIAEVLDAAPEARV